MDLRSCIRRRRGARQDLHGKVTPCCFCYVLKLAALIVLQILGLKNNARKRCPNFVALGIGDQFFKKLHCASFDARCDASSIE